MRATTNSTAAVAAVMKRARGWLDIIAIFTSDSSVSRLKEGLKTLTVDCHGLKCCVNMHIANRSAWVHHHLIPRQAMFAIPRVSATNFHCCSYFTDMSQPGDNRAPLYLRSEFCK